MPRRERRHFDVILWLCLCISAIIVVSAVQTIAVYFGAGPDEQRTIWARLPSWPLSAAAAVLATAGWLRKSISPAAARASMLLFALIILPLIGFHALVSPLSSLMVSYDDAASGNGVTRWFMSGSGRALTVRGSSEPMRRAMLESGIVRSAVGLVRNRSVPAELSCAYADAPDGSKRIALRLDADGAAFGAATFLLRSGFRRVAIENCLYGGASLRGYEGLPSPGDVRAIIDLIEALKGAGWQKG